jgi:hypothetical protein
MILALIWLLVVAIAAYLVARFLIVVLSGAAGPPWLPQAIWLIATLIVLVYFVERTLPVLLHSIP